MTLPETILDSLQSLPPDKQQEVLDFVEFLKQRSQSKVPLKNFEGLWADYDFDISEEDLAEARREMWGNFPRDVER